MNNVNVSVILASYQHHEEKLFLKQRNRMEFQCFSGFPRRLFQNCKPISLFSILKYWNAMYPAIFQGYISSGGKVRVRVIDVYVVANVRN